MSTEYTFLDSVSSRLHRIAASYASGSKIEADDLFQEMVSGLIVKAQKDPRFPQQSQSYICKYAGWIALMAIRSQRTYTRYVESVPGRPQAEPVVHIDSFTHPSLSPEKALEQAEMAFAILDALKALPERHQAIVRAVYSGLSNVEIAGQMGVSASYISKCRREIEAAARRVL